MQVILLERIEKLGQLGEEVTVKPGYARNYLLPQGKALRANKVNKSRFETERVELEANNLERRGEAEKAAEALVDFTCVLLRQASDSAQLYGSVTARDIADASTDGGVKIDRQQVQLDRPIKTLGIHPIRVALHPEVIVAIKVNVARTAEEAEAQELALLRPQVATPGADTDAANDDAEAPSVDETFKQPETVELSDNDGDEDSAETSANKTPDESAAEDDEADDKT
jgi:large subunit ribosomal protein L9